MKTHVFAGFALLFLASCAQPEPLTQERAAHLAAACFGWQEDILDQVSVLRPGGPVPGGSVVVLAFANASSVTVSPAGECGRIIPTRVMSPGGLRHLPPHAITEITGHGDADGMYILMLMSESQEEGYTFIGMKGGETAFPLPPEHPA
jgi:hypothetical protein